MTLRYLGFRFTRTAALAALVAGTPALAPAAQAPTDCIPQALAIPGLPGPPTWFEGSDVPVRTELDDPRWAGAPLVPFASAAAGAAPGFRLLRGGDHLYLSFHAPAELAGGESVLFGFSRGEDPNNASPAYLAQITPVAGSAPFPVHTSGVVYYKFDTATKLWSQDHTAAWADQIVTYRPAGTGLAFAVNFRAHLAAKDVNPKLPFRVFAGMMLAGGSAALPGTVYYSTPQVPGTVTQFVNSALRVPALPRDWALYTGYATPCRTGLTLDVVDVSAGEGEECLLSTTGANTFSVTARRAFSESLIGIEALRTTISISDWGAVPYDSTAAWKLVADSGTSSSTPGWTRSWSPGGSHLPANVSGNLLAQYTCTPPSGGYCPALSSAPPPGEPAPQMVLASVSRNPEYDVRLRRPAAVRNVAFIGLSEHKRRATISVRGLPKPKTGAAVRDVYFKVVQRNMPEHGSERQTLPLTEMRELYRAIKHPLPERVSTAQSQLLDVQLGNSIEPGKPLPLESSSATQHELLSRAWPLYEVHAFYDTGEVMAGSGPKGTPQRVLAPLVPFAYALYHEGPFYGFSAGFGAIQAFTPAGRGFSRAAAKLEKLGDGLYRVSVPTDGYVELETTLRAEERPKKDCCDKPPVVHVRVMNRRGCYCRMPGGSAGEPWLLPVSVLPLAVFFWRRRHARKRRMSA